MYQKAQLSHLNKLKQIYKHRKNFNKTTILMRNIKTANITDLVLIFNKHITDHNDEYIVYKDIDWYNSSYNMLENKLNKRWMIKCKPTNAKMQNRIIKKIDKTLKFYYKHIPTKVFLTTNSVVIKKVNSKHLANWYKHLLIPIYYDAFVNVVEYAYNNYNKHLNRRGFAPYHEKVCTTAGAKFGSRKGQPVLVVPALYGLKSSGARTTCETITCMICINKSGKSDGRSPCLRCI